MSQYKAAMERMNTNSDDAKGDGAELSGSPRQNDSKSTPTPPPSPFIAFLERHASFILMPIIPLLWCVLLLCTLDRHLLLSSWGMPLLGIGSATLANAVPVGGGIVFVPLLSLWGIHIQLGAAFAVATMTFGNGVFGFLSWLRKDPQTIYSAWYVILYAVLPAWIGAAIGILRPLMSPEHCRTLFALFSIKVAALVSRGLYLGRRNMARGKVFALSIVEAHDDDYDDTAAAELAKRRSSARIIASICSFLAGIILVAHIGIGNAVTTFLVSTYVWRLPAKSSVVVAIIVGGFTSFVPFLLHLLILGDVPIALWVMGLPGVYLGARIAPAVHERIGIVNVLATFVLFLLFTAVLMVST